MILDTTFLIDLLRNEKSAAAKARELDAANAPILTTAVNVFELWQGIGIKNKERRERILELLSSLSLLDLDFKSAKRAGEIYSKLRNKGKAIDPEDSMIAGIALQHGETILTRDVSHFGRIPGLRLEAY